MTKKRIGLCRVIVHFRAEVEKRARKVPINDSVEQLLSHLFRKSHEITLKYDQETVRGVAKTQVLRFQKSSKIPTYLLVYFECWKTRFPDLCDFYPKCYLLKQKM